MTCFLSYDLAYVVVENWLLEAGDKAISADTSVSQLHSEFFKIMMVNSMFKRIFFRLFKQNFFFKIDECLPWLAHSHLMIRDQAPLFREIQLHPTRSYGTLQSKWVFAMMMLGDHDLLGQGYQSNVFHLPIRKSTCAFDSTETQLHSFMRLVFHKEEEFIKLKLYEIPEQVLKNSNVDVLHCTLKSGAVDDKSLPSELLRVFNVGAKDLRLYFSDIGSSGDEINSLFNLSTSSIKCTEQLRFLLSFSSAEPFDLNLWTSYRWRVVLLYAVQVCPNLQSISLEFNAAVVDISQVDQLYLVMIEMIGWLVDEVLPKRPADCRIHVKFPFYIANGIYSVTLQPQAADLSCSLFSILQLENFFEILTFLVRWFIDECLTKLACMYKLEITVFLGFASASEKLFAANLKGFADKLGFLLDREYLDECQDFKYKTSKEHQFEANWILLIR